MADARATPPAPRQRRRRDRRRLEGIPAIPEDALILITTRNLVLFPGTVLPITLGRQRSIVAAQTAIRLSRPVGLVLQRDPTIDDPMPVDLHRVGTEANLLRYVTSPDGSHHVICQGERRFRVVEFLDGYPFFVARIERVPESEAASKDIDARLLKLRNQALEVLQLLPQTPAELVNAVQGVTSAPALADLIASFMDITPAEKQELLETFDLETPARPRLGAARLPARSAAAVARDQRAHQGDDRRAPAQVPAARAAADDPEGARRRRRRQDRRRSPSCARRSPRPDMPEEVETHARRS